MTSIALKDGQRVPACFLWCSCMRTVVDSAAKRIKVVTVDAAHDHVANACDRVRQIVVAALTPR
jgi:hypothetical protein